MSGERASGRIEAAPWARGLLHAANERVVDETGGPARRLVVVALSLVLALDAADRGAVGAIAFELERGLHIGNAQVGLMVTVSSLVAALATIPLGALVDRVHRVRLVWASIVVWAVAEGLGSIAPSYGFLVGTRVLLGVAVATAGPAVASLTGDFFPARDRGRVWGLILTGEVLGTGVGILYAGLIGGALGWRAALFSLILPSLAVAWFLRRSLPEPARGGASRLSVGATHIRSEEEVASDPTPRIEGEAEVGIGSRTDSRTEEIIEERGVEPQESIVISEDPARLGLWASIRYVLRVRTNVILIISSSLGYFFLSGLETFGLIYLRGHYGLSQGTATMVVIVTGVAVVVGLLAAGRFGDRLVKKGRIETRITIGVVGFLVSVVALAPAIATSTLAIAIPLFMIAGFALSAPNPALDAARLDVVPSGMWGRSEGVRTLFRQSLQGLAPLTFGVISEAFGAPSTGFGAGVNADSSQVGIQASQVHSLELTLLIMLVPVVAGGLVLLLARRTYLVDVASALESDHRRSVSRAAESGEDRPPWSGGRLATVKEDCTGHKSA